MSVSGKSEICTTSEHTVPRDPVNSGVVSSSPLQQMQSEPLRRPDAAPGPGVILPAPLCASQAGLAPAHKPR